ncbi:hypothetical protein ACHWQZ_G017566 [Mnemiopsis leidyi]
MSVLDHTSVDPAAFSGITAIAANVLFVFLAVCYIINSKYHVFQGVVESFAEFAQDTTAHGVKFFFQGKKLSRVCFFVVWLAAVIYTCYTCYTGIVDYRSHPTGTKFEIRTSDDVEAIPFPTISLCNINKIRKDYLDKNEKLQEIYELINQIETPGLLGDHTSLEDEHTAFLDHLKSLKDDEVSRTKLADIYKEGGPLDSDILACKIGFQDCSDVLPGKWFERKVSHQGNCFKINPNGLYNASIAGHLGGLSLFLHAQNKQYSLVKITEPSEGFKISFHDHMEAGNVGNTGFVVSPGLQYFIQLGYRETILLQEPYGQGDCIPDPSYRASACMDLCIEAHIIDTCGCIPFLRSENKEEIINTTQLCTLEDMMSCVLQTHRKFIRNSEIRAGHCKCDKACKVRSYHHSVSSSLLSDSFIARLWTLYKEMLPSPENDTEIATEKAEETDERGKFSKFKNRIKIDNESLAKGIERMKIERTTDLVKKNIVILKISFPTIEKHTIKQVASYGFGNLLGDIGGVLGLFLGASVFTVLEFMEYIVRMFHQNISNFRAKKKKEKETKKLQQRNRIMETLGRKISNPANDQKEEEESAGEEEKRIT